MTLAAAASTAKRPLVASTWGLFVGVGLMLLGGGVFSTLLGIRSELEQLPTTLSGTISAAYYAGFLIGSKFTLRALRQVGHIRVYAALAAFLSTSVLLVGLIDVPVIWVVLRMATGLCFAGLYVVAESWIHGLASNDNRGRLLSVYAIVIAAAFGLGQLSVVALDPLALTGFAVAAVITSLAVLPVTMSEQATVPEVEEHASLSLRELARIVPTGVGTILLVGLAHGSLVGMAAIYATRVGLDTGATGLFLAIVQIGGMVMTFPLAAASDDIDRRIIGLLASLIAVAASVALVMVVPGSVLAFALVALVGGMSYPLYSLAGAYTNDWIEPEHLSAAATQLLTMYGVGAMLGPFMAAVLMDLWGADGYFWALVMVHLAIALFLVHRIRAWHAPVSTRPWREVSLPARAFFVPATLVAMGIRGRQARSARPTADT